MRVGDIEDKNSGMYEKKHVETKLKSEQYGALVTLTPAHINSRHMAFAATDDLSIFYFMTPRNTRKVEEVAKDPRAALSVLCRSEELNDYADIHIAGKVTTLERFDDAEVQRGLHLLAEKIPMIQGVLDSESLGDYVVLKLKVERLEFSVYGDGLDGAPPTIFEFDR